MVHRHLKEDPDDDLYHQMPIIFQKTSNRSAVPLSAQIKRAVEQGRAPVTWRDIGPDFTKVGLI
jgi:hypothetical protein